MGRRHWGYTGGNLRGAIEVEVSGGTVVGRRQWGDAGGGVGGGGVSEEVRGREKGGEGGVRLTFEI